VIRLNDLFGPSDRDVVMKELRSEGIGCNNYFPPIHLQPYMKEQFGFREGDFPVTESLASRTLALPFFTKMTEGDVDRVVTVLNRVLERVLMKGTERR
jgi:perosamine synthetase